MGLQLSTSRGWTLRHWARYSWQLIGTSLFQLKHQFCYALLFRHLPRRLNERPYGCKLESGAVPISPPMGSTQGRQYYACYVDWQRTLYRIHWEGEMRYPDLTTFPLIPGVHVEIVLWSQQLQALWANSQLVSFGADAFIVCTHTVSNPIYKIAFPREEAQQRLTHEFRIMTQMRLADMPIPDIDPTPITEDGRIVAFGLERLVSPGYHKISERTQEVRTTVSMLHQAGFVHGDLSPSNVMLKQNDDVVLIDFGCSGRHGHTLPPYIPEWAYNGSVFDYRADEKRLDEFFPR